MDLKSVFFYYFQDINKKNKANTIIDIILHFVLKNLVKDIIIEAKNT